jgi:hypothetical protein
MTPMLDPRRRGRIRGGSDSAYGELRNGRPPADGPISRWRVPPRLRTLAAMVAHFLLYTGWGSLVMVLAVSTVLAAVVWYALCVAVAIVAWVIRAAVRPRPAAARSPRRR